jgi:hypothetical protein
MEVRVNQANDTNDNRSSDHPRRGRFTPAVAGYRLTGCVLVVLGIICATNAYVEISWRIIGIVLIITGGFAIFGRLIAMIPIAMLGLLTLTGGAYALTQHHDGSSVLSSWGGNIAYLVVSLLILLSAVQAFLNRKSLTWL